MGCIEAIINQLPSGELTFCHGKIHHAINGKIGKSTISMAIFNCYVSSPEGKYCVVLSNNFRFGSEIIVLICFNGENDD